MDTKTQSLYELLGGQEVIQKVVDDFYKRILADTRINHYFEHLDMTKQRAHQSAFISQVLGGPEHYSGRSMLNAHKGLDLSKADFDAVAGYLAETLEAFNVPQVHIDTVMSKVAALEREILYKST